MEYFEKIYQSDLNYRASLIYYLQHSQFRVGAGLVFHRPP